MAVFEYRGTDADGKRRRGFVEAESAKAARRLAAAEGVVAESLSRPRPGAAGFSWRIRLYESLGVLLNAGFSIDAALRFLAGEEDGDGRGAVLVALDAITGGKPLVAAMESVSPGLPPFERATLAIADRTGAQGDMLVKLAGFMESDRRMRDELRSALSYPAAVFCFALLLLATVAFAVVPRAAALFPADAVPGSVKALRAAAPAALAFFTLSGALAWRFAVLLSRHSGNAAAARRRESALLRMPVLNRLVPLLWASRYAGTMALLLRAGLSPQAAIAPAGEATGSATLAGQAKEAEQAVCGGAPLSSAIAAMAPVAPLLSAWTAVGEKSGALAEMLERASDRLRGEYARRLRRALSLLEPALVALVGAVVLAVALAVLRPMLDLTTGGAVM